jgi:iron complex transport system permease protein
MSLPALYLQNKRKDQFRILLLLCAVPVMFLLDLSLGTVPVPLEDTWRVLTGNNASKESWHYIILETRLPQAITALIAGAGLACGGLLLQTFFRNPLAGPSVLGISSGAMLGVAVLMLGSGFFGFSLQGLSGNVSITIAAFAGAMLVLLLIMLFSRVSRDPVTVLIAGLMVGYLIGALVNILQQISTSDQLQKFVYWGFGSFSGHSLTETYFFSAVIVLSIISLWILVRPLNAWILGEQYARSMGIKIDSFRWQIILITGLLAGTVTAFCGPVAFVGLAVPHLVRRLIRSEDHAVLIPSVAIAGALLCSFCSVIARLPFSEQALPLNAVTSLIGAPVVIWVILRRRKLKGGEG